jgi:hypothetical protein
MELLEIDELAGDGVHAREAEACAPEFDNYVPCYYYNGSEAVDVTDLGGVIVVISYERQCARESRAACVVTPPQAYRTPVRLPSCK